MFQRVWAYSALVAPALAAVAISFALDLDRVLAIGLTALAAALPAWFEIVRTRRLLNEQKIRHQTFTQELLDLIPDPIFIKDRHSRFVMVNDAFAAERRRPKADLIGLSSTDLAPTPEVAETALCEDQQVIAGGEVTKEQHTTMPITGEECYRVVYKRPAIDLDGQPIVFGMNHYITRWKITEIELQQQAYRDSLTKIANRRYFTAEAVGVLSRSIRNLTPPLLAMIDLDHFKHVNDTYGHPVGDEVLVETVKRCQACLRRSDLIGRWGGEEFIILFPSSTQDEAVHICDRLRLAVAETPFLTSAGQIVVTISIGLAAYQRGEDLEHLVSRADHALYQAKHDGRNLVCLSPVAVENT